MDSDCKIDYNQKKSKKEKRKKKREKIFNQLQIEG